MNSTHRRYCPPALLLGAFAALALTGAARASIVTNGSFELTIARAGNDNGGGMLATSANIGYSTTGPNTVVGWNITRDAIACVTFPINGTNGNNVCGSARFAGSGFQAGGPGLSPDGGNFILIDGDRDIPVSTSIYQLLNGLIVGQTYQFDFRQAAAQFLDRSGATTERWDVSLGGDLLSLTSDGNFIGGQHCLSNTMNTPSAGFHAWERQSCTFTVKDSSLAAGSVTNQILGFFSVGTPGGQPPIVLLDGVSGNMVPEPESLALVAIGLVAAQMVSAKARRRTRARTCDELPKVD